MSARERSYEAEGTGPRAAGLAIANNLMESAQTRWRALNRPALVRSGVKFERGVMVERSDELNEEVAA